MEKLSESAFSKSTDDQIWNYYGMIETELNKRGLLRTRNIIAERGEAIVIEFYNKTANMPKLQLTSPGTKYVNAISRDGERYAIKAIRATSQKGSTFQTDDFSKRRFEYLILVKIDELYRPLLIAEATWDVVNKYKAHDKTMKAFYMPIHKKFLSECKIHYNREKQGKR